MNRCCRCSISCVDNYDRRERSLRRSREETHAAESSVWMKTLRLSGKKQKVRKQGGKLLFILRRLNRFQTTFGPAQSTKHFHQYSFYPEHKQITGPTDFIKSITEPSPRLKEAFILWKGVRNSRFRWFNDCAINMLSRLLWPWLFIFQWIQWFTPDFPA